MRFIGGSRTFPLPPPRPVIFNVLSRREGLVEVFRVALQSLCQLKDRTSQREEIHVP